MQQLVKENKVSWSNHPVSFGREVPGCISTPEVENLDVFGHPDVKKPGCKGTQDVENPDVLGHPEVKKPRSPDVKVVQRFNREATVGVSLLK